MPIGPVIDSAPRWQQLYRQAVTDPAVLCQRLGLAERWVEPARRAAAHFGLRVPEGYLQRIRPGDPHDPLLRQVLPLEEELAPASGFSHDPLAEQAALAAPGVLHKYHGRVLIVASGACAVHCRYCFRRHFPYDQAPSGTAAWPAALETIAADPSIHEVLLSGGDPLSLADSTLAGWWDRLAAIPHVRRIRLHTRLPVVIPERLSEGLLELIADRRLQTLVVVHINHAQEIDAAVAAGLSRLVAAGGWVLNQAVLLRGVNDSLAALEALCLRLVELRVQPYYLHQLDRVQGAQHFEVPVEQGRQLMRQLRARLPGYALPRYVQERPGEPNKTPLE